tara:strand:+ start:262 stop:522 length:261 start_codon:yes stop_codon:yes gene_type:complete
LYAYADIDTNDHASRQVTTQPASQATSQPASQPASQATSQPVADHLFWSIDPSARIADDHLLADRLTVQPVTSQLVNRSTSKPVNQ